MRWEELPDGLLSLVSMGKSIVYFAHIQGIRKMYLPYLNDLVQIELYIGNVSIRRMHFYLA